MKWTGKGVATALELSGAKIPIKTRRPTVSVAREQGFNVRTRKVGPKGKKVVI